MGRRRSPALPVMIFATLAVLLAAHPPLAQSSGRHHHHGHRYHVQSRGHGGGRSGEEVAAKGMEVAAKGMEAATPARVWPCCDNCGGCTKSNSPQCQCLDAARGGCHPACRDCVRSSLSVDPPVYQCMDRVPNFCQRRCTAVAAH